MPEVVLAATLTALFLGLLVAILVGMSQIQKYEDECMWRRTVDKKFILAPGYVNLDIRLSNDARGELAYISNYLIDHEDFDFFWRTILSKYTDENNGILLLGYSKRSEVKLKLLGIPHKVTTMSDIIGIEVT